MPKTSNEGPTYAGLVDVSPPETATPEWVPADSEQAQSVLEQAQPDADVSRETKHDDKHDDKAEDDKQAKPAPRPGKGRAGK